MEALTGQLELARAEAEALRAEAANQGRPGSPDATGAAASESPAKVETRPAKRHTTTPPPAPPLPEDAWDVVRLATRHAFRHRLVVQVNNAAGVLCDLSSTGCQVVSSATVKPNQVLKVVIPWDGTSITCSGKVVWAKLEPPAAGRPLGYRAGVHFTKVDHAVIDAFIATQSGRA
jgi:hypothetical protein